MCVPICLPPCIINMIAGAHQLRLGLLLVEGVPRDKTGGPLSSRGEQVSAGPLVLGSAGCGETGDQVPGGSVHAYHSVSVWRRLEPWACPDSPRQLVIRLLSVPIPLARWGFIIPTARLGNALRCIAFRSSLRPNNLQSPPYPRERGVAHAGASPESRLLVQLQRYATRMLIYAPRLPDASCEQ